MKNLLSIILLLFGCLGFYGFTQNAGKVNEKTDCEFIVKSINEIQTIKVGMTRKNLLEIFETEGGIYTRTQNHYAYKKCTYIKVKVKFSAVGDKENNPVESPNDKIIEISKPYLEYPIGD